MLRFTVIMTSMLIGTCLTCVLFCSVADMDVAVSAITYDPAPKSDDIAFAGADGGLYLFSAASGQTRQLTNKANIEETPRFSPDGARIIYASKAPGAVASAIRVVTIQQQEMRQLTHAKDVSDRCPSYSPDGEKIAFARAHRYRAGSMGGQTWDQWDVYIMDRDGANLRRLTRAHYHAMDTPRFLDQDHVVFSAETVDKGDLKPREAFVVSSAIGDHQPARLLAPPPGNVNCAAWVADANVSADGSSVVFISDRDRPFHYDLYLLEETRTKLTRVPIHGVGKYNCCPAFARQGDAIFFLSATSFTWNGRPILSLMQVGTDGRGLRQVIPDSILRGQR